MPTAPCSIPHIPRSIEHCILRAALVEWPKHHPLEPPRICPELRTLVLDAWQVGIESGFLGPIESQQLNDAKIASVMELAGTARSPISDAVAVEAVTLAEAVHGGRRDHLFISIRVDDDDGRELLADPSDLLSASDIEALCAESNTVTLFRASPALLSELTARGLSVRAGTSVARVRRRATRRRTATLTLNADPECPVCMCFRASSPCLARKDSTCRPD